jgi:hypothetical protein
MNPDQFIELERVRMMQAVCGFDKAEHCTFVVTGASPPLTAVTIPAGSIRASVMPTSETK